MTAIGPPLTTRPINVLDVPLASLDEDELLTRFTDGMLVFHNLDTVYKAKHDARFRSVCRAVEHSVIDGQVLRGLVSLLWGRRVAKVAGSDFLPAFCHHHAADPSVRIFLLGAGPGVAAAAADRLNMEIGRRIIVGAHSPSFSLLDDDFESAEVVRMINLSGATVLAVGLGAPKQELWMARHRASMPAVTRFMAVGASLDFQAGRVRRAPTWMTRAGLEWAFRLALEPRRLWRRYLVQGPQVMAAVTASRLGRTLPDPPRR